ncbi:MAG: HlyD family type I secretion periplasmic adaptor subunit [Pseudohongiella sp.]|nr:HlyD family type I secretion periplasmic adaptor subunit [Pseudohongiella sp.]
MAEATQNSNQLARMLANANGNAHQLPSTVITSMEKPKRIGLVIFFLVFGVFGVWASVAPLDGAAHAPGSVTVRSNRQLVQHLEGGIVSEIRARNGDVVRAGDPLLILDNTQSLAQLEIATSQYLAMRAMEARLIAERDGLDQINFPADLTASAQNAQQEIASQSQIFLTRKAALEGSVEVLEQRIGQLQSRLGGLRALQESKQDLANSFAEELRDVQALLVEGFADKNRLRELERNAAMLRGEAAELTASISSTEIEIGETRLQILQQELQFQNEVANQLAETQTSLKDASERMTAIRSIVARTTITAPVAGVVNGMQVHTIGGVVPPGQPLADIVPQNEELIIEARISPIDIDRIAVGQEATIRFSSFSSSVPNIYGKVIHISADAYTDPNTGMSYYGARVEVTPEGLEDLGNLILIPGMPAEVFITTGSRTLMQYFMKPFSNALARSFIED